ncbi:hypothetical protein MKZ38_002237 [Zalerion maritima]|uniref:Uncharacterized protein n=1 Tax=Zalerion maritima TaxID=339359 RepID=A0AAD5WSL1_9PEZI|nr:hypothetical protein MKZ38_002237 [Zalerion maritima]
MAGASEDGLDDQGRPIANVLQKLPGFSFPASLPVYSIGGTRDFFVSRRFDCNGSPPSTPNILVSRNLVVLFRAIIHYAEFHSCLDYHLFFQHIFQDCFPDLKNPELLPQIATLTRESRHLFLSSASNSGNTTYETSPLADLVDRYHQLVATGSDPLVSRRSHPTPDALGRAWDMKRCELKQILKDNISSLFDPSIAHLVPGTPSPVLGDSTKIPCPEPTQKAESCGVKRERGPEVERPRKKRSDLLRGLIDLEEEEDGIRNEVNDIKQRLPRIESTIEARISDIESRIPKAAPVDHDAYKRKTEDVLQQMLALLNSYQETCKTEEASHRRWMADEAVAHKKRLSEEAAAHKRRLSEAAASQKKRLLVEEELRRTQAEQEAILHQHRIDEMEAAFKEHLSQLQAAVREATSKNQAADERLREACSKYQAVDEMTQSLDAKMKAMSDSVAENLSTHTTTLQKAGGHESKTLRTLMKTLTKDAEEQGNIMIGRIEQAEKRTQALRSNDYKMKSSGWESKMQAWNTKLEEKQKEILRNIDMESSKYAQDRESHDSLESRVQKMEESHSKNVQTLSNFSEMLDPAIKAIEEVKNLSPRVTNLEGRVTILQSKGAIGARVPHNTEGAEKALRDRQQEFERTIHDWALHLIESRVDSGIKNAVASLPPTGGVSSSSGEVASNSPSGKAPPTSVAEVHAEIVWETKTRVSHIRKLDENFKQVRDRQERHSKRLLELEKQVVEKAASLKSDRPSKLVEELSQGAFLEKVAEASAAAASASASASSASITAASANASAKACHEAISGMQKGMEEHDEKLQDQARRLGECEGQNEVINEMGTDNQAIINRHVNSINNMTKKLCDHHTKLSKLELRGYL